MSAAVTTDRKWSRWLTRHERSAVKDTVILVALCAAFWILRISYWKTNTEAPFSDMADYVEVADNIVSSFTFGVARAPTYFTPVTPSLIAIAKLISPGHFQAVFQCLTQLLAFVGMLALAREIRLLTGQRFLALALVGIVAFCRPSIFWSLKIATEPLGEALLYLASALILATLRTQRFSLSLASGMCSLLLGLNRPNYLPGILLVLAALAVCTRTTQLRPLRSLALPAVFLCGFFGLWLPWVARNYLNYGDLVPTSSSGYLAMLWEEGGAPLRPGRYESLTLADRSKFSEFGLNNVLEAWRKRPTPAERTRFIKMLSSAWLAENWTDLPRVMAWRLRQIVSNRSADGLTKLSREELFLSPQTGVRFPYWDAAWINVILLDKTPTMCLLSLVGLGYLLVRFRYAAIALTGLLVVPWIAAAGVIANSRYVESLVAFDIWFAFFGISCFVSDRLGRPIGSPKDLKEREKSSAEL
jgi:hypothetical protein